MTYETLFITNSEKTRPLGLISREESLRGALKNISRLELPDETEGLVSLEFNTLRNRLPKHTKSFLCPEKLVFKKQVDLKFNYHPSLETRELELLRDTRKVVFRRFDKEWLGEKYEMVSNSSGNSFWEPVGNVDRALNEARQIALIVEAELVYRSSTPQELSLPG